MSVGRGVAILSWLVRDGLSEKTIKSDLTIIREQWISGLSEQKEEHAKAGACLVCSRNCQEASVASEEWVRERW